MNEIDFTSVPLTRRSLMLVVGEDSDKAIGALEWTLQKFMMNDSTINNLMIVQIVNDYELNAVTRRRYELPTDLENLTSSPQKVAVEILKGLLAICYDNEIPSKAWLNSGGALDISIKEEKPDLLVVERWLMLQLSFSVWDSILSVSQFIDDAHCAVIVGELGDIFHIPENSPQALAPIESFADMCLDSNIMKDIASHDYTIPTSIQAQAMPVALSGRDLLGWAETGSGKTAAFAIPMIQHCLAQSPVRRGDGPLALVLAPTRELAQQIEKKVKAFSRSLESFRTAIVVDGTNIADQRSELQAGVDIVVATPERFIEHLQQGNLSLSRISYVVLDEADRMLDMGFEPQIREVMQSLPENHQTLLFSATMPVKIGALAQEYLRNPVQVKVGKVSSPSANVSQVLEKVPETDKIDLSSSRRGGTVEVEERERPHVLVVDDSNADRLIIERLLLTSSFKVTTAEDGPRALELLGRNNMGSKIKMIITDYSMPGMTGYDLLKKVKESSDLKEIPVVIMSSENDPTRIEKCLEEGAHEFILKPVKRANVEKLRCYIKST